MLIDFRSLLPKYNITPNGIIHIGGNIAEEFPVYMEMGIIKQIWFEPNPKMYEQLVKNISSNNAATAYPYCLGDEDKEVILHESNNAGQSSSILELGTHKQTHPEVHYISDINVMMIRLDSLFTKEEIKDFDFLNIDVQGAELKVLKGIGDLLHNFKAAYLEVNKESLYVDCALVEEIDSYMLQYRFERIDTFWCGNTGWGDALYIKK